MMPPRNVNTYTKSRDDLRKESLSNSVNYISHKTVIITHVREEAMMNVVELIEKRKFKAIEKNVNAKRLECFFFSFLRLNNLYKGKNKNILKIWKIITRENGLFSKYNEYDFVNFKYVCEFIMSILGDKNGNNECGGDILKKKNVTEMYSSNGRAVVDMFLYQLVRIILYCSRHVGVYSGEVEDKKGDQQDYQRDDFHTFADIVVINEQGEFEILFNKIHPLIYNTYVQNMVADVVSNPLINANECFLRYVLYVMYKIYINGRDALFFYFIIYTKWKKIKSNIVNTNDLTIHRKVCHYVKKRNRKTIWSFKILRRFLFNLSDRVTIHNFVRFIFSYLRSQLITICPNDWEKEIVSYKKEKNAFEFSLFVDASIRDLAPDISPLLNYDLKKIKNIIRSEQAEGYDLYTLLHIVNISHCDDHTMLKCYLIALTKCVYSFDMSTKNGENVLLKMRDIYLNRSEHQNSNTNGYTYREEDVNLQVLKKETFYTLDCVLNHIYICCYIIVNSRKNFFVKYDDVEENVESDKCLYNYCHYSDVNYVSNYLGSSLSGEHMVRRKYVTMVALLLHMKVISIDDIWSFRLLRLVENNIFFHILNMFRYRKKNVLFCLTLSNLLKVKYEAMLAALEKQEKWALEKRELEKWDQGMHVQAQVQGQACTHKGESNRCGISMHLTPRGPFYMESLGKESLLILQSRRKEVKEYASKENRLFDILTFLAMDIQKSMIRLPLKVLKSIFKEIFKYLSKPIHDVKKRIHDYFSSMCLRIVFYLFELIFVLSSHIYYLGEVYTVDDYNVKFYLFSFYFNLIDVYINFVEKYNARNNTFVYSLLNYHFVRAFLFLFDYTSGVDMNEKIENNYMDETTTPKYNQSKRKLFFQIYTDGYLLSNEQEKISSPVNHLACIEDMNMFRQNYTKYVTHRERNDNILMEESNFDETFSQYVHTIMSSFLRNNKREVNYNLYTLLMYAIAKLHVSYSYRYREVNYLPILHILPWKSCLLYAVKNTLFSSYFFQKFYESLQILLPEIAIEQIGTDFNCAAADVGKPGEVVTLMHCIQGIGDNNPTWEECIPWDTSILTQVVLAREIIHTIFFTENGEITDVGKLETLWRCSNLLKSCVFLIIFIEIYFLGKMKLSTVRMKRNIFMKIIHNMFDEQMCSYYISIFQNPLNFFLKCSKIFCQRLIVYDYMDTLVLFIFTKLYHYLSLIPPKLSPQDFLPISVDDITSLQETAIAQFIMDLRREEVLPVEASPVEASPGVTYSPATTATATATSCIPDVSREAIFSNLPFFLKKMDVLVKTFGTNCLNSVCESGFNMKSAFYLSFYMTPPIFANIFYCLNNNIMAIVSENFQLDDNIKYYEHVHVKKGEYTLEAYNILDKTLFYLQIVVFYLIVNANNKLLNLNTYMQNVCTYFINCLQMHEKPHVHKFILASIPTMLQYFYFFPSFIPNVMLPLAQITGTQDEFAKRVTHFRVQITAVLEASYRHGGNDGGT
ncbi:conserved Plasmodium protein, unknown function [Plasmodium ovale curtisi]|uniref:Uncharacterized protein n=2 Tax=Plasmodium ovale TaxID=36330 RepID=A0A1A8W766_PLAOA|nr:conserved Plasmodium protein, unknown function [Plasmodium ovale curtisi]